MSSFKPAHIFCWVSAIVFFVALPAAAQPRSVELEIQVGARAEVGTQQKWMEMLQNVGADRVVVKTGTATQPAIEELQLSSGTLITVTGVVQGNRLLLPGGSFSINDKGAIASLISKLRDDGTKVAMAEKKAFGLTSEQLVGLHQTLSQPLNFSTKGVTCSEAVQLISQLLGQEISLDPSAQRALDGNEKIAEELNGISAGTALAIIARPLGLVLEPQRLQGQSQKLRLVDSKNSEEHWPIGWPPEKPPVQVEPKLFEKLALEIRGFPLNDALNAIEKRTGVPFFYDHNSFARQGVEMSQSKVTVVQEKISFMVAIGKLLRQSKPKLIEELRIDENSKPFLWITTQ